MSASRNKVIHRADYFINKNNTLNNITQKVNLINDLNHIYSNKFSWLSTNSHIGSIDTTEGMAVIYADKAMFILQIRQHIDDISDVLNKITSINKILIKIKPTETGSRKMNIRQVNAEQRNDLLRLASLVGLEELVNPLEDNVLSEDIAVDLEIKF